MRRPNLIIRSRRGNVAIEYALILPAFLLFVLGVGDTGRLFWTYTAMSHAVDAAARCGAIAATGCTDPASTADFAATQAYGLMIDGTSFDISTPACGYQVHGTYPFVFVIPWIGESPFGPGNGITIDVTACYPT